MCMFVFIVSPWLYDPSKVKMNLLSLVRLSNVQRLTHTDACLSI